MLELAVELAIITPVMTLIVPLRQATMSPSNPPPRHLAFPYFGGRCVGCAFAVSMRAVLEHVAIAVALIILYICRNLDKSAIIVGAQAEVLLLCLCVR
jgi:hypothetical protein